jgi:hypothetical protein
MINTRLEIKRKELWPRQRYNVRIYLEGEMKIHKNIVSIVYLWLEI